ncbi:MAG: hypothetical protein OIF32_04495 [Campylobacterales bacterium]|nr:hypothetical protein [Campylobacterales bacterium]
MANQKVKISLYLVILTTLLVPFLIYYFYTMENNQYLDFINSNEISIIPQDNLEIFVVFHILFSLLMITKFITSKIYSPTVEYGKNVRDSNRNYIEDIREKTKQIEKLKSDLKSSQEFLDHMTEYTLTVDGATKAPA